MGSWGSWVHEVGSRFKVQGSGFRVQGSTERADRGESMKLRTVGVCAAVCVWAMTSVPAQEREDRTLLTSEQMRAIINEASGERAMHHVLELVPYQRVRPVSEYSGNLRESEVMARFAKEYGYSNVAVETFPQAGQIYQATVGELW